MHAYNPDIIKKNVLLLLYAGNNTIQNIAES